MEEDIEGGGGPEEEDNDEEEYVLGARFGLLGERGVRAATRTGRLELYSRAVCS